MKTRPRTIPEKRHGVAHVCAIADLGGRGAGTGQYELLI